MSSSTSPFNQSTQTSDPHLPRPLKDGEFYCHQCQKFLPMSDHEKHSKFHMQRARRGQDERSENS